MPKKPTISTLVGSWDSASRLNTIFQGILDALDNTLSRDGSTPNTMEANLDLNGNDIINVGEFNTNQLKVSGVRLVDATAVPTWEGAWETGVVYQKDDLVREAGSTYICLVEHTSGTFSTDLGDNKWELFAQQGAAGAGTGDMLAANNLSDVANVATARSNLGLGSIATEAANNITQYVNFNRTDAINLPRGTGAQRPGTPVEGDFRVNSDTSAPEVYANAGWQEVLLEQRGGQSVKNKIIEGPTRTETNDASWGASATLEPDDGLILMVTLTASVTTLTDNIAADESMLLLIDDGTDYTITWPTMTWLSDDGVAPTLRTTGLTSVLLWKDGTTLYGFCGNGA